MWESRSASRGESGVEIPSRYRVHRLPDPKVTERGIVYRRGDDRLLLEWARVKHVLAAHLGDRAGVSRVVFDLAIETRGSECVVCRVDAAPGDEALALARSMVLGVGRDRCSDAVHDTATEGRPARAYADLDAFDEANLEILRFGG